MGVKVELLKDSPSDVVANTQETLETAAEKPENSEATLEQMLRRLSRTSSDPLKKKEMNRIETLIDLLNSVVRV